MSDLTPEVSVIFKSHLLNSHACSSLFHIASFSVGVPCINNESTRLYAVCNVMVKKSYVGSAVQFNRLSPYQKQMIYFFHAENSVTGLKRLDTNRWRLLTELTFSTAFNKPKPWILLLEFLWCIHVSFIYLSFCSTTCILKIELNTSMTAWIHLT
jgi:hypothetical protein